jgi:hypothetical protein
MFCRRNRFALPLPAHPRIHDLFAGEGGHREEELLQLAADVVGRSRASVSVPILLSLDSEAPSAVRQKAHVDFCSVMGGEGP